MELMQLYKKLVNDKEWQCLYELVKKKKEYNVKGTFLAYVAQTIECSCMLVMDRFMTMKGRTMAVFCYDGGMVVKLSDEKEFPNELLRGCEEYIETMTGFKIQLKVKPMSISPEFTTGEALMKRCDVTDAYMADLFIQRMKENILRDRDGGIMIFDNGHWTADEDVLYKYMTNSNLVVETMEGMVRYSGFVRKQELVMQMLPCRLTPISFISDTINKSIGKLIFSNGVYDFKTRTFVAEFDASYYCPHMIATEFPSRNEEDMRFINKILFEDPFLEEDRESGVYMKKLLARAVAGHYNDRVAIWAIGEKRSSKGTLSTALGKMFGSAVGFFNANSLLVNPGSSADEAKKHSWILPLCNNRLNIANESEMLSRPINGGAVKMFVSGGDVFQARANYKDEMYAVNRSTLVLFLNDMPKVVPADESFIDRMRIIEYKLMFVKKAPGEEYNAYERPAIEEVKYLFDQKRYCDAFFWLLADAYEAEQPMPSKAAMEIVHEWVPPPAKSLKSILEEAGYIIVKGDTLLYVATKELEEVIRGSGELRGFSSNRLAREMTKMGLGVNVIWIDGKAVRVRTGIGRR
jgi:hypothetical protein